MPPVDKQLEPEEHGTVKTSYNGSRPPQHGKLDAFIGDIERHGEVHASFEGMDSEVECRLGTTHIDFRKDIIEVFDGDQWCPFSTAHLITWDVPMEVFH